MRSIRNVLVLGASGSIGQYLVDYLCGRLDRTSVNRVMLLQRVHNKDVFNVTKSEQIDITKTELLTEWLNDEIDILIFLIGTRNNIAKQQPHIVRKTHFDSFVKLLDLLKKKQVFPGIIYASSTAAQSSCGKLNNYGDYKFAAERSLINSGIPGMALRFPTIVLRPNDPESASFFLNAAIDCAVHRKPYIWPIEFDRKIRLMSRLAAVRHIVHAIECVHECDPIVLDLPATIISPRLIHTTLRIPEVLEKSFVSLETDAAFVTRPVAINCNAALELGFDEEESIEILIKNSSQCRI